MRTPWLSLVSFCAAVALARAGPGAPAGPSAPTTSASPPREASPGAPFTNSVGMTLVWIPPGSFLMGAPPTEPEANWDEIPRRRVTIARGFWMGRCEVTQAQYEALMGKNPSRFRGPRRPVERVSWYEAMDFCARLSAREGLSYRLPSDAQWEYACRAGARTPFHFGATITADQVNFDGQRPYGGAPRSLFRQQTLPVGSLPANAFGLHDMHGNVREWCLDAWHRDYVYVGADGDDWLPADAPVRITRGGSWHGAGRAARAANRFFNEPDSQQDVIGFRVTCHGPAPRGP